MSVVSRKLSLSQALSLFPLLATTTRFQSDPICCCCCSQRSFNVLAFSLPLLLHSLLPPLFPDSSLSLASLPPFIPPPPPIHSETLLVHLSVSCADDDDDDDHCVYHMQTPSLAPRIHPFLPLFSLSYSLFPHTRTHSPRNPLRLPAARATTAACLCCYHQHQHRSLEPHAPVHALLLLSFSRSLYFSFLKPLLQRRE